MLTGGTDPALAVLASTGLASTGLALTVLALTGPAFSGTAGALPREACVDRRAEELATRSPLGARRRGRTQTCRRDRVRPARGREPGPSLISPAHQDAKLEDLKGLPGGRLGTARQFRRYLREPSGGSTVTSCSRRAPLRVMRRTAGAARRRSAARGGSRPGGKRASTRRRSKTRSARSATAGSRRGAALPRS